MGAAALATTFGPLLARFAVGLLPPNASSVIQKITEVVKTGIGIAEPLVGSMQTIAGLPEGDDISIAQMNAALAQLHTPGVFEAERAKLEAKKD